MSYMSMIDGRQGREQLQISTEGSKGDRLDPVHLNFDETQSYNGSSAEIVYARKDKRTAAAMCGTKPKLMQARFVNSLQSFHHSTPASKKGKPLTGTVAKKVTPRNAFLAIYHDKSSIAASPMEANNTETSFALKHSGLDSLKTFNISHIDEDDTSISIGGVTEASIPFRNINHSLQPLEEIAEEDVKCEDSLIPFEDSILKERMRIEALCKDLERKARIEENKWDIYSHLRVTETQNRPSPSYLSKQPVFNPYKRAVLINWLVEAADEIDLHRETLFLAVIYIDRFFSRMSVAKDKFQLAGITCLHLASLHSTSKSMDIDDLLYFCEDMYTLQEFRTMNGLAANSLILHLAVPTAHTFCERMLQLTRADDKTTSMAMYLLELTLLDATICLNYLPSIITSACICLAYHSADHPYWSTELIDTTEYIVIDFIECFTHVYNMYTESPNADQQATRDKYMQCRYHKVAAVVPRPSPFSNHCATPEFSNRHSIARVQFEHSISSA